MQPEAPSASSTCPSPISSSNDLHSRTSSFSSHTDISVSPPHSSETLNAHYSIGTMKESLDNLDGILNRFMARHESTDSDQLSDELKGIRNELNVIQKTQSDGTEFINLLMQDLLAAKSIEVLQKQVDEEIKADMDKVVKEEVDAYFRTAVPSQLVKNLKDRKLELEKARRDLHNSESKRLNALLREKNLHSPLHTLYRSNGSVSDHFPKSLDELFSMDAATCKALVNDYEIENSTSRDGNLNRFMVFCGVQYQMVRQGSNDSKRVAFSIEGA
ncbi:hypothetical protein BDP27DRAFT_1415427 [Rhodocollybia butyracea]|uniref:Uncharacterized protein n=1 Tax=Rhodocollybia butyracea TaxID=206335 RepID=A0A9P5Q5W0_9AGAR|nr:hypothetical protein BDP27DRAFT_1415427 [Rhodocollybia butyracea]